MSDLKPCPFCGGDDVNMGVRPHFREGKGNGWTVLCADCGGSIGYIERPDGHFYAEYDTKSEAIAAWNSRAERTCKQEERGWGTEGDHARVWLTCGHDCMVPTVQDLPNYCPNCGAKVVGE